MNEDPVKEDPVNEGPVNEGPVDEERAAGAGEPAEGRREADMGAAESGRDADGSGADGSGADGSGADGSGADGSGADGSGADRAGADGRGAGTGTEDTRSGPADGQGRLARLGRRVPQVLALAVVWVLLWGSLKATTIVGGVLVGLLVTWLFPLPLLPERLPVRPLRLLRLAAFLLWDLVVSGIRVSSVTLRHGRRARAGIVGLPLCAESDRTTTTIAAVCALSPGSFVLQIDRARRRWYVYALGLHRPGAVDRVRRDMLRLQLRVVEALGSAADIDGARRALDEPATGRATREGHR